MPETVKTKLVRVGNSRGVRIPAVLLQLAGLSEDVELEVQDNQIVIRSARRVREGWAEAFEEMAAAGDDRLLEADYLGPTEEWQWE